MKSRRVTFSQFIETKNSLIHYYTSQQASHSARLIGFAIALFTLLQTVQHSKNEPLSSIFSELAYALRISEMHTPIVELCKFSFLFLSISFLITMLIRTIFRFMVYAYYAQYIRSVRKSDITSSAPLHATIHNATFKRIKEKDPRPYGFHLIWFIPTREESQNWIGYVWSVVLATISTSFLIWFLWSV